MQADKTAITVGLLGMFVVPPVVGTVVGALGGNIMTGVVGGAVGGYFGSRRATPRTLNLLLAAVLGIAAVKLIAGVASAAMASCGKA